jgi:transposase
MPYPSKLSVAEIKNIVKLYKKGNSIRTIAALYDVDYGTIRKRLINSGVQLRGIGNPSKISVTNIEKVAKLRAQGYYYREIAVKLGLGKSTVGRIIRNHITRPPK